jgi:hypothetical protein
MGDKQKVEAVIRRLLSLAKGRKLNRTQLIKLAFLVDYESCETFGVTVTDVVYKYDHHGPMSWDITDSAARMPSVAYHQTAIPVGLENTYTLRDEASAEAGLTTQEDAVCQRVMQVFGGMSAKQLVEYLHNDGFVDRFKGGRTIDFGLLADDPPAVQAIREAIYEDQEVYREVKKSEAQMRECAARR